MRTEVIVLDTKILKDICYFIPCPKSPHGCDVDPTGEYIVGSGKLAALIPVFSFTKLMTAINNKDFIGDYDGIPVVKYESALYGEVKKPGLGPLHTEFDGKGIRIYHHVCFFRSCEMEYQRSESGGPPANFLFSRPSLYSRRRYKKSQCKIPDCL